MGVGAVISAAGVAASPAPSPQLQVDRLCFRSNSGVFFFKSFQQTRQQSPVCWAREISNVMGEAFPLIQ
ncbi:hypothetical protein Y1Q_0007898 [Alligator mississippiensis]|uniref:Uncharacterized protein n=1 Tax=Alligator mississippiensis TaxID=8496 RepID=A0A151NEU3_ALLMI|nr:hypothetical protein Y1Q_0007898 [Alligator mississippiensis]